MPPTYRPPPHHRSLTGLALVALLLPPIVAGLAETRPGRAAGATTVRESMVKRPPSSLSWTRAVPRIHPIRGIIDDHNDLRTLQGGTGVMPTGRVDAASVAP